MNVWSSANAIRRGAGFEIEHLAAGEVLTGLGAERGQIGLQPAAGHEQRHRPQQARRW